MGRLLGELVPISLAGNISWIIRNTSVVVLVCSGLCPLWRMQPPSAINFEFSLCDLVYAFTHIKPGLSVEYRSIYLIRSLTQLMHTAMTQYEIVLGHLQSPEVLDNRSSKRFQTICLGHLRSPEAFDRRSCTHPLSGLAFHIAVDTTQILVFCLHSSNFFATNTPATDPASRSI